jgi:membrane protein implicated in regulation of membrane protease activity
VQAGAEALVGKTARVVAPCRPDGRVRVEGELWRARCEAGADVGESVRVVSVEELTLEVARID